MIRVTTSMLTKLLLSAFFNLLVLKIRDAKIVIYTGIENWWLFRYTDGYIVYSLLEGVLWDTFCKWLTMLYDAIPPYFEKILVWKKKKTSERYTECLIDTYNFLHHPIFASLYCCHRLFFVILSIHSIIHRTRYTQKKSTYTINMNATHKYFLFYVTIAAASSSSHPLKKKIAYGQKKKIVIRAPRTSHLIFTPFYPMKLPLLPRISNLEEQK